MGVLDGLLRAVVDALAGHHIPRELPAEVMPPHPPARVAEDPSERQQRGHQHEGRQGDDQAQDEAMIPMPMSSAVFRTAEIAAV